MMTKVFNWLFRQTKVGQVLDGNKRLIGFGMAMIGWLIGGLAIASQYFPGVPWIAAASVALVGLQHSVGDWLTTLGYGMMALGVADGALKDREEREAPAVPVVVTDVHGNEHEADLKLLTAK